MTGQHLVLQTARASNDPAKVQLAAAVPDASFLPITAVNRAMAATARKYAAESSRYAFPPGNPALRHQIARRMADLHCDVGPEDIVITSGAQESLTLALHAISKPGDVVAIESPAFYGLLQVIEASGLQALEIPTHPREGISLEALQLAAERWPVAACVVVSNFSNPLGFSMPDARKQALVERLAARGIALIEDDVYGDLSFSVHRPSVAKSWDMDGRVIYCSSFSKTLSPSLRLGWIAPGRYRDQVEYDKYPLNLASATLPQLAIAQMLERGGYDRFLVHLDLHETTDSDESEFRPRMAERDGTEHMPGEIPVRFTPTARVRLRTSATPPRSPPCARRSSSFSPPCGAQCWLALPCHIQRRSNSTTHNPETCKPTTPASRSPPASRSRTAKSS